MSLFVRSPSRATLDRPEAWRLGADGRGSSALRFWAGEEGPWDADLRVSEAPGGRRIMLSVELRPRSRRVSSETWGLLLADAVLPLGDVGPLEAGRALLAGLARSRDPEALERLALARRIAGLLLPPSLAPEASWLVNRGRLRWSGPGRARRLPLGAPLLEGLLCRGPFGAWGLADGGALAGTAGEARPPSRHERLAWTEGALAAAERRFGRGAARALARAVAAAGVSGG